MIENSDCYIIKCDGEDCTEAILFKANLTEANLTEAILFKADLFKANLKKVFLSDCDFSLFPDFWSAERALADSNHEWSEPDVDGRCYCPQHKNEDG